MFKNKPNLLLIEFSNDTCSRYYILVQEKLLVYFRENALDKRWIASALTIAEGDTTGSCNASCEIQLWRPINYKAHQRQGPLVTLSPACYLSLKYVCAIQNNRRIAAVSFSKSRCGFIAEMHTGVLILSLNHPDFCMLCISEQCVLSRNY